MLNKRIAGGRIGGVDSRLVTQFCDEGISAGVSVVPVGKESDVYPTFADSAFGWECLNIICRAREPEKEHDIEYQFSYTDSVGKNVLASSSKSLWGRLMFSLSSVEFEGDRFDSSSLGKYLEPFPCIRDILIRSISYLDSMLDVSLSGVKVYFLYYNVTSDKRIAPHRDFGPAIHIPLCIQNASGCTTFYPVPIGSRSEHDDRVAVETYDQIVFTDNRRWSHGVVVSPGESMTTVGGRLLMNVTGKTS